jgi:hypothetical protein
MPEDDLAVALLWKTPTPQSFAVEFLNSLSKLTVLNEVPTKPALIQRHRLLPGFHLATVLDEFERIPESRALVDPSGWLEPAPGNELRAAGFVDDTSATIGLGNVEITADAGADRREWVLGWIRSLTHW